MFVHLHLHSQYSILDATASIEAVVKQVSNDKKMPAVALTDHGNMYGAVDFYKACKKAGIKPIIGCEFYVAPRSRQEKNKEYGEATAYHLTVLAKNQAGYRNLCKLTSKGFLEGFYYYPRIDEEILWQYSEGLIVLSGCLSSSVAKDASCGNKEGALQTIRRYHEKFGEDYYLEIQRHKMSDEAIEEDQLHRESWLHQRYLDYIEKQERVNDLLVQISREEGIPLVATNDVHYIHREDWKAHEILLNVQSGEPCEIWENDSLGNPKFRKANPKRRCYESHECYLKSSEQMMELFKDLPEAIANTVAIAEKCQLSLDFETKHYPVYYPPSVGEKNVSKEEQKKAVEEYLWQLCKDGIPKRYTPERLAKVKELFPDKDPMQVIHDRLAYEMSVIVPKEMSDYLLIVWDFIHWAKNRGIPMGPGRGSGAGSIVLYLIGVTDIEPLRFSLFFERFINPERISYPDIDVDICMDRRAEVINYTLEKYGKDNVAQIITFGTMKAKSALKDVGRVLSVPLSKVNAIAKLVPDDLNITLDEALEKDPEFKKCYDTDEEARRIIDYARNLEGSIRSCGIHAAGVVISGEPLVEHIPICNAKDSEIAATQYSMKPVEQVGMLKIDFLGLKTLTCIQKCVDTIRDTKGTDIDWINLPLDDANTFNLLNQGKTQGIFQLESTGMQELARNLHLDKFEEIIAIVSLYRPGPMDMIPSFIARKHGREPIEYDHPAMKEILSETYGIMVYQEQVMQIAQTLASYSLGEGDVLRRAMGKKDGQQMAQEREKFRNGAIANGIDSEVATRIFDKMEKFAAYGFNKSHAAAYAYLSYVTSYLKANYPMDWMAALMTCDRDDLTKVSKLIREAQAMGIAILPPDVNEAAEVFIATESGIRFAMSGIKGVGSGVVETILQERKKGKYKSLHDFIKRIDTTKVGKKTIEHLVEAGCFDFTGWSRDALKMSVEPMYEASQRQQKEIQKGYLSLFGASPDEKRFQQPPVAPTSTPKMTLLLKEKELLGFFLTGHPLDGYKNLMTRLSCLPLSKVESMEHDAVFRAAVIIETIAVRFSSKSQKKFAILTVSDGSESYELPIWPEMYEENGFLLTENQLLYAVISVDRSEGDPKLSCRWIGELSKIDEAMAAEADAAFDKAKSMNERQRKWAQKDKEKKEKEEKPMSKPVATTLKFAVDINKIGLQDILKFKEIFQSHPGPSPIEIKFLVGDKLLSKLVIGESWGVNVEPVSAQLKKLNVIF